MAWKGVSMSLQGHPVPTHHAALEHRANLQSSIPAAIPPTLGATLLHLLTTAKCHLIWEFHLLEHYSEYRKKAKRAVAKSKLLSSSSACIKAFAHSHDSYLRQIFNKVI